MGKALLVEFYEELPRHGNGDSGAAKATRLKALNAFRQKVVGRYTEGTLQRLLASPDARSRRAAVLALELVGTMASNACLARTLRDEDAAVRDLAAGALWSLWFRADTPPHNRELQRILRNADPARARAGLDALIRKAPRFAEAYNQRAILSFRLEEYERSVEDCQAALKLNPFHFGALAGMAQCYMRLRKPRAALRAFRHAFRINPGLEEVGETIRALEDALGGEGRKDDRK